MYYRAINSSQTEENAWYRINASAGTNDLSALPLECDTEYEIKVSAWNELGESNRSESWQVKCITGIYIIFSTECTIATIEGDLKWSAAMELGS